MAPPRSNADRDGGLLRLLSARLPWRVTVVHVVVAIALLAILARLLLLGDRVAHWDEARVAYWIDYYADTGSFAYRRIIHGPWIQHVNRWLFPLFGGSDFLMRVPVALVGGLLPLSALLFRAHLRDDETVALALFLGANAVLLYYSRFMRSDLLVAAFMFTALGLLVRFYDTRRFRYLYGVGAFLALGFASKENAVVYLLTWVGAAALLADQALYRPRSAANGVEVLRRSWLGRQGARLRRLVDRFWAWVDRVRDPDLDAPRSSAVVRGWIDGFRAGLRRRSSLSRRVLRWSGHLVGAGVVFLALIVFFYGARGAGLPGLQYPPVPAGQGWVGLWEAVGQPAKLPGYVGDTLGHTVSEFADWFGHASDPGCHKDNVIDGWLCFLGRYVEVLVYSAGVLTVFALVGFVWERYGRARTRNLVLFTFYGGFVSILGYPLGTDVFGAWLVVHAVVPLAIPAAVGVSRLYVWGREAALDRDAVGAGLAALVLVLAGLQVGMVAADSVYIDDQSDSNHLVQYAQPADDLRPTLEDLAAVAADPGDGVDLHVYYGESGESYVDGDALVKHRAEWDREADLNFAPRCTKWFNLLPMPWYIASTGADVDCSRSAESLTETVREDPPPIVLTAESDTTVPAALLEDTYEPRTYTMRTTGYEMTFWVDEDRVGAAAG